MKYKNLPLLIASLVGIYAFFLPWKETETSALSKGFYRWTYRETIFERFWHGFYNFNYIYLILYFWLTVYYFKKMTEPTINVKMTIFHIVLLSLSVIILFSVPIYRGNGLIIFMSTGVFMILFLAYDWRTRNRKREEEGAI